MDTLYLTELIVNRMRNIQVLVLNIQVARSRKCDVLPLNDEGYIPFP